MDRYVIRNGMPVESLLEGQTMPEGCYVWLDLTYDELDGLVPEVQRLIGATIYEDHLADARNMSHPSFFDNTSDYELIVFRGLAPNASDERISTRPIFIFLFDRLLATVRAGDSRSVAQVKSRFMTSGGRVPRTPDELTHRLLSAMVDHYLDLRQPMLDRVERWQTELLDPKRPFNDWRRLLAARNEIRRLEHLCEEQYDAVQEWRDFRIQDISQELQVRITDLIEHIGRVLNHVRRVEATMESAVQLHFSAVTHRTSEIMRTLTLITAVFMPLTLITGIFGMNFEMIPGLHSRWGFWASLGLMAGVVVALLWYFRTRRWM